MLHMLNMIGDATLVKPVKNVQIGSWLPHMTCEQKNLTLVVISISTFMKLISES